MAITRLGSKASREEVLMQRQLKGTLVSRKHLQTSLGLSCYRVMNREMEVDGV